MDGTRSVPEPGAPGPGAPEPGAPEPGESGSSSARAERPGPSRSLRTAVVWEVLSAVLAETDPDGAGVDILDAGGGTGGFAVPLAQAGHRVTVLDPSPDSLAALQRRATEQGLEHRITPVQGDLADLPRVVEAGSAALVLCHSVLDVVDDPAAALAQIAQVLRPDGRLSLLVANRDAAVLGRALAGRPQEAAHVLTDPRGRWGPADAAARRWTPQDLRTLVGRAGLQVQQVHGVRVLADLLPGAVLDGAGPALLALERDLSTRAPFRDLATQTHVLAGVAART